MGEKSSQSIFLKQNNIYNKELLQQTDFKMGKERSPQIR